MNRWILAATLRAICAFAQISSQDARQIVAESQKRAHSNSQRYEGDLEVLGGNRQIAANTGFTNGSAISATAKPSCVLPNRPR